MGEPGNWAAWDPDKELATDSIANSAASCADVGMHATAVLSQTVSTEKRPLAVGLVILPSPPFLGSTRVACHLRNQTSCGGSSHGGTPDGMDSLKDSSISAWVIRGGNSARLSLIP
jgi:hypothetical protein